MALMTLIKHPPTQPRLAPKSRVAKNQENQENQ